MLLTTLIKDIGGVDGADLGDGADLVGEEVEDGDGGNIILMN